MAKHPPGVDAGWCLYPDDCQPSTDLPVEFAMFTLNTFAVAVLTDAGVQVFAKCHNRVTAEFYLAKFSASNVVLLAPGASFDADVSHIPSVAWWVAQPRLTAAA